MKIKETYLISILNIIFSLRMLGIFMILPVLSTYGMKELIGANVSLIGIAIGIYGFIQIIFQIPFGLASDKFGRKPIIIGGLLISSIGTSIASITNNIWGVIIGRALQGTSAISGTLLALLSDLIKEQNKTKTMMFLGLNFSITFAISIILGPIITDKIGLQGLFLTITVLTLLATIFAIIYIPQTNTIKNNHHTYKITKIIKILNKPQLIKLNLSIFFLHTILILNFIALPKMMNLISLLAIQQSKIYCINILVAFAINIPIILYSEKKRKMRKILIIFIYILLLSEIIFSYIINNYIFFLFGLLLFFISFNMIEGILPSILMKETPIIHKGLISGMFSTSQFLGTTCGGISGGYLLSIYNHIEIIFFLEITLTITWLIIINSLKEPPYIKIKIP